MMTHITRILGAIESGDRQAAGQLLPLVYDELRKLATVRMSGEAKGQTLQATALVHEAYLRLVGDDKASKNWDNRGHFFSAAAEAMRRILIDRARAKGAIKRGGGRQRLSLDPMLIGLDDVPAELIELDEALVRLASEEPLTAEIVKLRFFAGLTLGEAAAVLGLSSSTADRKWAFGRAWLYNELGNDSDVA